MSRRGEIAENLFKQGYNCAQSVALAFQDLLSLDEPTTAAVSAPFGGGLAGQKEVCGAVQGAAIVLGLLYPCSDPKDRTARNEMYEKVRMVTQGFKDAYGSVICGVLLGLKESCDADEKPGKIRRVPCFEKTKKAADLLADVLGMSEE